MYMCFLFFDKLHSPITCIYSYWLFAGQICKGCALLSQKLVAITFLKEQVALNFCWRRVICLCINCLFVSSVVYEIQVSSLGTMKSKYTLYGSITLIGYVSGHDPSVYFWGRETFFKKSNDWANFTQCALDWVYSISSVPLNVRCPTLDL